MVAFRRALLASLFSATAVCQVPCQSIFPAVPCTFMTLSTDRNDNSANTAAGVLRRDESLNSSHGAEAAVRASSAFVSTRSRQPKQGFHWRRALFESFVFLSLEQAYVVHDDYHWVVAEDGVPLNHYWRDYKQSLSTWIHSGWDDGDSFVTNYIGHPIQGALTGYIQVQNDPQGEKLEFSNSKAYWSSRFKAMLWNTAYSTQWKIGPLSEMTVEKYGTQTRGRWNRDGTWPCKQNCVSGVGQVDLIVTPLGGLGWMLVEDILDKEIARRVEGATRNQFLIDFTRCALNPIRAGANILHSKRPWYRASRDANEVYLTRQVRKSEPPISQVSVTDESH
jgi:hypothetical protein